MSQCNACRNKVEQNTFLQCRQCKHRYHFQCLNIQSAQYASLSKDYLASWLCPACSNVTRRNKPNLNTPVKSTQVPVQLDMSCDNIEPSTSGSSSITSLPEQHKLAETLTLSDISRLLDNKLEASFQAFAQSFRAALRQDIKDIVHKEMTPVIQTVKDEFSVTTDFISEEQRKLKAEIDAKDKRIKQLETSRACNIELQAVPEAKNENLLTLFKKLCSVINIPMDDTSIRCIHRVAKMDQTSKRPRNILVSLSSSYQRDQILSAAHRFNKLHRNDLLGSTHLGISGEHRRIFVAEHLSPSMKSLYAECRKLAKETNYKFVWVRYGKIFVRRDESSSPIHIKTQESLKKLSRG
ncbi:hypothetical protein ABMA28_000033 [Loxostege sticticalis]|uniref:PHD-type domain-containing protein n=1 Tax=Loxostege sticticalis TaxID=481309 RepID=A0ABD0TQT1_LOXSC